MSQDGILKAALIANKSFQFTNDFLSGWMKVDDDLRDFYARSFFIDYEYGYKRFLGKPETILEMAPAKFSANKFLKQSKNDKHNKNDFINIKYGLVRNKKLFRWDSAYESYYDDGNWEGVRSAVVIRKEGIDPFGFFSFNLSLHNDEEDNRMTAYIRLNLIYIRPEFRGSTHAIDLTIALVSFLKITLNNIFSMSTGDSKLEAYITADFESGGGEKVTNYIFDELSVLFDVIREECPENKGLVGKVLLDAGY